MIITNGCEYNASEAGEAFQVEGRNKDHTFTAHFDADLEVWTRVRADLDGLNGRRLRPVRTINGVIQWMRDQQCTEILTSVIYDDAIE